MSLRDQIVNAQDTQSEKTQVPEWGGITIYIRSANAQEIDEMDAETISLGSDGKAKYDRNNIRARLLVRCMVDENGQRIFKDDEAALLAKKNSKVIQRLYKIAERLNKPEDIEEAAKNS